MKWDSKTLFVDHHFVFYKSWMRMTSKRFSWPNVVTYFVVMMVSMMVMRQNNDDVDDGDDDGKDFDDERPLLLWPSIITFFCAVFHLLVCTLVATDPLCKSCNLFRIFYSLYFPV